MPAGWVERLRAYGDDLPALPIVVNVVLEALPPGSEPRLEVRKAARAKCDRCWMNPAEVGREQPGLCGRCTSALAARA